MLPESRYLRQLTRAWLAGAAVPAPPPAGLQWDRLLSLLGRHRVVATLGPLLLAGELPAPQRHRLGDAVREDHLRTSIMLMELERVLPALEASGCQPLLLKGAALALDVYPQPEQRWLLDIDLLVPRDGVNEALAALAAHGYHGDDRRYDPAYYDAHHFHRIVRNERGLVLELHWAISLARSAYRYDPEDLRRGAREVACGTTTARVPSAVDLILHTVLQNTAGGFEDLRRLLDAALLERRLTPADREMLVARARRNRLATALWLQYQLLAEVTGVGPPPATDAALRPGGATRRCLTRVPVADLCLDGRLDGGAAAPVSYPYLLHCLCVPGSALKMREIGRYVFPGEGGRREAGLSPEQSRRWSARTFLTLQRLGATARATGYLAGCLLGHR